MEEGPLFLPRLLALCRPLNPVAVVTRCVFLADDGRTKPIPRKGSVEGFEPSDNKCLLRATDGKKKISTVVSRVPNTAVLEFKDLTEQVAYLNQVLFLFILFLKETFIFH